MLKKIKNFSFVLICLFVVYLLYMFPYEEFMIIKNDTMLTRDEFNNLTKSNLFISAKSVLADSGEDFNEYVIKFNLFNLFNVKNLRVNVAKTNEVLLGGDCVGLNLKSKGVVVAGSNYIITKNGNINPVIDSGIKVGDVILKLNGENVNNLQDIQQVLNSCNGEVLNVEGIRDGESFKTVIKPELDVQTNSYKLGMWISEDTIGVGTLTFINPENRRFGCLGHAINRAESDDVLQILNGDIYKCNVVGVKKGTKGVPGEILGLFVCGRNEQGVVDTNNNFGVYGNLFSNSELMLGKNKIKIGGRLTAKPGKATILTCIDGLNVEEYDIELIKTNYQLGSKSRSMVIKVTDPDLINETGGIVQGMSGSPIIQNGKIVGAVTHVFVNDPTKGFGLYLDWMLNE